MGRKVQTQWEFGELFPAPATRRVFTVSELTGEVKQLLEQRLGQVWVTGEISNLRLQASGHVYFTLKDAKSQLSCVLFRGVAGPPRELLIDGRRVVLQGDLTVYEPRGQYQLVVRQVEFQGIGALQLAFEQLKQKLQAEGLFAAERKRPLPPRPRRIGLVTSPTGAALQDVLHVVRRRNPTLEILLAPSRVQGDGAAAELVAALELLNAYAAQAAADAAPEVILVTRGGGSLEDLWSFNEEAVARAIAASALPVVSAVGHEIDFTISDFVADCRAATPSAAAELLTEGVQASRQWLAEVPEALAQRVQDRVDWERERLETLARRLERVHPRRRLQEQMQRLDELHQALGRGIRRAFWMKTATWESWRQRWLAVRPRRGLEVRVGRVADLGRRLADRARHLFQQHRHRLQTAEARLRLLSPANVLERGYSITMQAETGAVVREATQVRPGQRLRTRLKRGTVESDVV